ncbi:MAG: hypothetical protein AAF215_33220 [Cyanobacteria bacterium P01_A01_bin.123]
MLALDLAILIFALAEPEENMGCFGGVGCFDFQRWCNEIVPALKIGEATSIVAAEIAELRQQRRWGVKFRGLGAVCMTFDHELCDSPLGRLFRVDENGLFVEDHKPLGRTGGWGYEELADLVEQLASTCITEVEVVGRTYRLPWLLQPLHDTDLTISKDLLLLAHKLDTQGEFWTHGSGGYGEGIHGWLDPEETAWLAHLLDQLFESAVWGQLPHDDYTINESQSKLRQVQRVANLSTKAERGLLWGGDLEIFYP